MKFHSNYLLIGFLAVSLISIASSCGKDPEEELIGNWVELSDYEGVARSDAASFSIGNLGYVGTGYDGDDRLTDFWAYDSDRNNWTQIAEFPGTARNAAVGFSAAGKGYVGTGYDGNNRLSDFWAYDPALNEWTQVADFAGTARYGAVAFSIENIGYLGTGFDGNYLKDFWSYNPSTNSWLQKTSFGGSKRRDAVGFVIGGMGYICTGVNNGVYESEFYMYDPASDLWTAKRKTADVSDEDFDNDYTVLRSNAVAFVLNNKAYVTTGIGNSGSLTTSIWEFEPATDLWEQRTPFEGATRQDAVAFSTENGRAFVVTGRSASFTYDDIWEFKPTDAYDEED